VRNFNPALPYAGERSALMSMWCSGQFRSTFSVLIAIMLVGCLSWGKSSLAADADGYRLGAGDKIHITVYNEKDLTGDFNISDRGVLAFPLIGDVPILAKTTSEVAAQLEQRLGKDYLVAPKVSVEVLSYRPFYIVGEVKNPGSYPYVTGMKMVNAVALAGGFTNRAIKDRFMVKRAETPQSDEQPAPQDAPVYPGDVIRVQERFF
jgi:polysaccharide export outer membrane protein